MFPEISVHVAAESTAKRGAWWAFVVFSLVAAAWIFAANTDRISLSKSNHALSEAELDNHLQQAATAALLDARGTIVVIDPQTGRIRAVVNPEIAFGESLPPGSTIKPFTTIAALNSGVVQPDSTTLCREEYAHDTFHTVCSHPRDLGPLNPTDAIAYSCNYYFGKVGERLNEQAFSSTLAQFGFGKKTGVNFHGEAGGKLVRGAWHSQNAIGESEDFYTTPIQLLTAYSALVNGGRLFVPQVSSPAGFQSKLQTQLNINDDQRTLVVKGMRGAVRYGTAESAGLYSLSNFVIGKTGTATQINGFRTQGWFVGFASDLSDDAPAESELEPKHIRLGVLVFLHKAHGSDAGKVARRVFEVFARSSGDEVKPAIAETSQPSRSPGEVKIHSVKENVTRTMSLENYILGVVAAEGSTETELAAAQALAITSRTYAVGNIGRHSSEGYDFCSTTHCQRFEASIDVAAHLREAVHSTEGQTIQDSQNQLADAYFSASCGGVTANVATLWGAHARTYLRGVEDSLCETGKHGRWKDVISAAQLQKSMQSDPRTSLVRRITDITVQRRDETGRAQLITINGDREVRISGWEFKIIVGRALGWNLLKSSRFEVSRSGSDFVFTGSGFGHGLGLCQEGAHAMAVRGANYRQILTKYFPGTTVASEVSKWSADVLWRGPAHVVASRSFQRARRTLSGEQVRISFPASIEQREIESLLSEVESHRRSLNARVSAAGLFTQVPAVEIYVNETTGDFVGRTGQPPWAAAATKGNRVELQPLSTLKRRNVLSTTLRHELVHVLLNATGGRTSRWFEEGLAIHFAGEGPLVSPHAPRAALTPEQIEQRLGGASSAVEMKVAYAAAYKAVQQLISAEGESNVWRRISR